MKVGDDALNNAQFFYEEGKKQWPMGGDSARVTGPFAFYMKQSQTAALLSIAESLCEIVKEQNVKRGAPDPLDARIDNAYTVPPDKKKEER